MRLASEAHDLPLPLSEAAEKLIAKRGKARKAKGSRKVTAWELDADAIELQNPEWGGFLDEVLDEMRKPLGISNSARLEVTLSKAVLHTTGGKLEADKKAKALDGVFGSLVVVLPSSFDGGAFVSATEKLDEKRNPYSTEYVVFYNNSVITSHPLAQGSRLSLVYDLATSTIDEVPRFAGRIRIQEAIDTSLEQFFQIHQAAKKLKTDSKQRNETSDHQIPFVYVLHNETTVDRLDDHDHTIWESLGSFCVGTGQEFELYLAGIQCRQVSYIDSESDSDDEDNLEITVRLVGPWEGFSEAESVRTDNIEMSVDSIIAPDSLWDELKEAYDEFDGPEGYGESGKRTRDLTKSAFVVIRRD